MVYRVEIVVVKMGEEEARLAETFSARLLIRVGVVACLFAGLETPSETLKS